MIKYDRFAPIQRSRINFSNTAEKRVYEMQVIDIYEKKYEEITVVYLVQTSKFYYQYHLNGQHLLKQQKL